MCPKATPKHATIHPIDRIWLRLRRPFRYPQAGHACCWERYDADRAGCVRCGVLHKCSGSMVGCDCPLIETDEGGHVCLITGLCISEVRASSCEFVSHVSYDQPQEPRTSEGVHERVHCIVNAFLSAPATTACRRQEQEKGSARVRQGFWRALKQRKRDHPYALPCLCSVVAEVAHAEQAQQGKTPMGDLQSYNSLLSRIVHTCSANIAAGILQLHGLGFKKICQGGKFHSMVVGMLYMSRTGLHAGSLFHLPEVRDVHELLPSEAYLNSLGVSNKVICDTENEIKSCIRAFADGSSCNSDSDILIGLTGQKGPMKGPMIGQKGPMIGQTGPMIGQTGPMIGQTGPMIGQKGPSIGRKGQIGVIGRKMGRKGLTRQTDQPIKFPSFSSSVCSLPPALSS